MIKFSFDYDDLDDVSIIDPEALKYYKEGYTHRKRQDYIQAIFCFDKAISICPSFYNAYLQKFFSLCEVEDIHSKVNHDIILSIDKAIKYCPLSMRSYLYEIKAEYYLRQKKYSLAVRAFKASINECLYNTTSILGLIKCYKALWDIPQIIKYYEFALSKADEYSFNMTRDANGGVITENMKLCPSSVISKHIKGQQPLVCEVTYPIAEICYEYSQFMHSIGFYSKTYFLVSEAISNSYWSQYIVYRIDLFVDMPSNLRTKYIIDNFRKDYARRKGMGGELFENQDLYLYNCLKKLSSQSSQDIDVNLIPLLFRGKPLSILQWAILHNKCHELSKLISEGICNIPEIRPFLEFQQYCVLEYDKRKSLFFRGLLNYYLGGIASSFIIFDDEFDMSFENLTSTESYFYSRIAKEVGIDFIEINTFAINYVKANLKTDEDWFFLGMMFLLDEKKEKAIECFCHGKSYKFSRFMLFALENRVEYKKEEAILKEYVKPQFFNIENGTRQLMDYFITIECTRFSNFYFYSTYYTRLSSEILPLWEVFKFDVNYSDIMNNKLLEFQIKKNIAILIANDCISPINNIDFASYSMANHDELAKSSTIDKLLDLIRLNKLGIFDVFQNTLWLYKHQILDMNDVLSINLYAVYVYKHRNISNLIKTAIYTGCLATSYINVLIGILFSSTFYYLDCSKCFDSSQMGYTTFSKEITSRLSQESDLLKILQRVVKNHQ